ncbi:MAG: AsmA-like C-terminal region-containing protein, partial [Pseudomonadota bacterium]
LLRTQEWLAWYARAFPVSGKTLATPPFVHLNVNAWQGPLFQWSDVQLQSQSDAHYWALECVSPDAKGKVAIPLGGKSGQPVYATFDTLVLSGLNTEDSLSSWRPAPAAWPIHVSVQELRWKESNFQDIKAKLLPIQDGWKLQNVSVQNGDITGQLQGVWHSQAADDRIALEGTCVVKNIAHTLASFNLDTAIRDASGNFQWHVAWSGGMSPKLSTIEGTAQATMRKGRILGFEPGIGRILGLLSVSNIQRRLTLDFRDITKKGFSFDEINGKVDFEQGWVKTDKLSLKGPIANLIFTGHGELGGKRQLEAEMLVSPQVSGTLPLAATLASGNPAVGIAVWVFNKVLSKEVNEMMQYRYAIAGTWDAPTMKELEIVPENKATHKQK